jgi:predicted transposase YdaD
LKPSKKKKKQIRESGKREGKREGRLGIARLMLQSGEPIEKIKRYTGLPDAAIRKMQQKLHGQ